MALSYDNFKIVNPIIEKLADIEIVKKETEEQDYESEKEEEEDTQNIIFKNGVHGKGVNMISKHDLALNGKRNAKKIMNFPPEFETGDGDGIKMSLSNAVYNTLKSHSMQESKRHNRLHDKTEKATTVCPFFLLKILLKYLCALILKELALDSKTRLILYKLVNAEIIDSIGGVISTGKEALILYAPGGKSKDVLMPAECVAKVYKTTLNEFKTRSKYIKDDYRFKDRYKHLNPRKIVRLWAEKV